MGKIEHSYIHEIEYNSSEDSIKVSLKIKPDVWISLDECQVYVKSESQKEMNKLEQKWDELRANGYVVDGILPEGYLSIVYYINEMYQLLIRDKKIDSLFE